MKNNIRWLREKLKSLNLDGMIVSNPINIRYLTDIVAEGVLIITPKDNIYITDARYTEMVNSMLTIEDGIVVYDVKDLSAYDYESFFDFCENVGFEENYVTYGGYKKIMQKYKINNLEETENIIEKQRMIKDKKEIDLIRKACEITDDCFKYICNFIKVGQTEKQIARKIDEYFYEHSDGISFDTIVASGKNGSKPHAVPTNKRIEVGDAITIDMGCIYKGYHSDMTRTVFVREVKDEIKEIYDLVLKNQLEVISEIREGSSFKQISKNVENDFAIADARLVHALGHGVGLEVHELPVISSKADQSVKNYMVFTDEPGIYIPEKFGVRIEDTIAFYEGKCDVLTKSEKDYVIVDKRDGKNF